MTHRTSLEVQARLQAAAKHADDGQRQIYAAPGARNAEHLLPSDYQAARVQARAAIAELECALALMDQSDETEDLGRRDVERMAAVLDSQIALRFGNIRLVQRPDGSPGFEVQ